MSPSHEKKPCSPHLFILYLLFTFCNSQIKTSYFMTSTCLNDWKDLNVETFRWTLSDVFLKEEALERHSLNVHQRAANSYSLSFMCGREKRRIKTEDDWLSEKSLKMFFRVAKPRSPFTKLTKELFCALLISSVWGLWWALSYKRFPVMSSNKSDTNSLITSKSLK